MEKTTLISSFNQKIKLIVHRLIDRPELFFLSIIIPFGLLSVFVIPPFAVPDENAHLYRAYQVSQGEIIGVTQENRTGGYLPTDLIDSAKKLKSMVLTRDPNFNYSTFLTKKINQDKREFILFETTSVYSPINYMPQALGITIARIIYPSEFFILYAGRIFNLAFFILIAYIAIKIVPVKKWLFVVVSLLPMTIHQVSSLSGDAVTIGISLIAIAYCLSLAASKIITKRDFIISLCIAAILGLTKQTNAILILPFMFLPTKLFLSKKRGLRFKLSVLATAFGLTTLWFFVTKILHYNMAYSGNPAVNMGAQIQALLHYPWHYLKVAFNTYLYNLDATIAPPTTDFYWQSMVGAFSWFKYQLPLVNVIMAYIGIALAILFSENKNSNEEKNEAIIKSNKLFCYSLPITLVAIVLAVGLILYLVWTPVGYPVIAGIQGRYYIPFIPLVLTLFLNKKVQVVNNNTAIISVLSISVINIIMMILQTIQYFY